MTRRTALLRALAATGVTMCAGAAHAYVPTVQVVGPNNEPVASYRWMIQLDLTHHIVPGVTCVNGDLEDCLSVGLHRSTFPPIAKGHSGDPWPNLDPAQHYFINVLPDEGYTNSGAPLPAGKTSVTIVANAHPLPVAQATVFAFKDNVVLNNAPDGGEQGLAGWEVQLFDSGGHYGQAGGQMFTDGFGNPLGTTYKTDGGGNVIYDAAGAPVVDKLSNGHLVTDANGLCNIKNILPGKYGVQVIPPPGQGWSLTSTIEGTPMVDIWVASNEPALMNEAGVPGYHAFFGFVQDGLTHPEAWPPLPAGGAKVHGQVRTIHMGRPPENNLYNGAPLDNCWVGINDITGGPAIWAQPCEADGYFNIPRLPAGRSYEMVIWDLNLLAIFGFYNFDVPVGATDVDLLEVPVNTWFGRYDAWAFYDANEDGFRDCVTDACDDPFQDEVGIPDVAMNLRFRDGSMYLSAPTDIYGNMPFEDVFPFFNFLIHEVDFARWKSTGATIVADDGGPVDEFDPWSAGGWATPQAQPENGNLPYRTEVGQTLLEAVTSFAGQTNQIQWGLSTYGPGENGGITGIVSYASTRAENDPRFAVREDWEPGIGRLQVALYTDDNDDRRIDDYDGDGLPTQADVDNWPFGWNPDFGGGARGPEDIDYNGDGAFDVGDAVAIVTTDAWDDSPPTGCVGTNMLVDGLYPVDCFDGLKNWNQVRPGVFDGGYAFNDYTPGGLVSGNAAIPVTTGNYIVAVGEHNVYEVVKEEDKNVDFGNPFAASPMAFVPSPVPCVGDAHLVPNTYTLFDLGEPPFRAGTWTPTCDMKLVGVRDGINAAADFHLFTEVPIAAHGTGMSLDDLQMDTDPNSPNYGEKLGPSYIPVQFQDFAGHVVTRTYADRWGHFNALLPSTFNANTPMPSGLTPNVLISCMNHPGPIENPAYAADHSQPQFIVDPWYKPEYATLCYNLMYQPGLTTYLDTPLLPIAAYVSDGQYPVDCEQDAATPVISQVNGPNAGGGPWVATPTAAVQPLVTIQSPGNVAVPNPAFAFGNGQPRTILRDYGFGNAAGTVTVTDTAGVVRSLQVVAWSSAAITARVPVGVLTGQLAVTRGDNGRTNKYGLTLNVGGAAPRYVPAGGSIQAAIDAAPVGALVMVPPGTYNEMVILWKPLRLQGFGSATVINAMQTTDSLAAWQARADGLVSSGRIALLPGVDTGPGGAAGAAGNFGTEQGPGILVAGPVTGSPNAFSRTASRIDGFTVTRSNGGGGIIAYGYTENLRITNNRVAENWGDYGGGIRVGHPYQVLFGDNTADFVDAATDGVKICNNLILKSGGLDGFGGGVSIYHGASNYVVANNFICGNFNVGNGGGVGQYGLSSGGVIQGNDIRFNETFNQTLSADGGGIVLAGGTPATIQATRTPGTGNVTIRDNLIRGNSAGSGDGGGIALLRVNGQDVQNNAANAANWYRILIQNNIVANNMAGFAGGGLSAQDAVRVDVYQNTIANNDSTATAGPAFTPGGNQSRPEPAGIALYRNSAALDAVIPNSAANARYRTYSRPRLVNDIVRGNRSMFLAYDLSLVPPRFVVAPQAGVPADGIPASPEPVPDQNIGVAARVAGPTVWVLDTISGTRMVDHSLLVQGGHYCAIAGAANVCPAAATAVYLSEYLNAGKGITAGGRFSATLLQPGVAIDEGGNFIRVVFGPLAITNPTTGTAYGDYHLRAASPALNVGVNVLGAFPTLNLDIDRERRPDLATGLFDIGADERQ